MDDKKDIRRLEKLLRIKKKNKLPQSFSTDGLDYVLGAVNSYSPDNIRGSPRQDEELEEDHAVTFGKYDSNHFVTSQDIAEDEGTPEEEIDGEDWLIEEEDVETVKEEEPEEDRKESEEVGEKLVSKYVSPHLKEGGASERWTRRVQGLMNRLSERNIRTISSDVVALYRDASRNEMNNAVWHVLEKLCSGHTPMSERFAMEQAMLVAILHHHVGTEVGAHLAQCLAVALNKELEAESTGRKVESAGRMAESAGRKAESAGRKVESTGRMAESAGRKAESAGRKAESAGRKAESAGRKAESTGRKAESLLLVLVYLYNYKVIHCVLVYDVIRKLMAAFSERNIQLLLLLLKNAGMAIRKDDPGSLKAVILQIQSAAASSNLSTTPRVKFMLETLSALKTNNARKIPGYDPSILEHMKKLLRSLVRTSGSLEEVQMKVSLEDLLNADKQGRWWVVGSAWTGLSSQGKGVAPTGSGVLGKRSREAWILDKAKQQRMNTDLKKTLFGVIMTSEDYVDCFQKLLKLHLSEVQEREIVHVLLDCCLQEKLFNPYYAYLGQKLCEFKKSYQITFQYSLWDRFKVLNSLMPFNLSNLKFLIYHLITKKALSLGVLKVVEFTELDDTESTFYKSLFLMLLTEPSEGVVTQVFSRIAPLPNLKKLRDGLLVFLNHYLGSEEEAQEKSILLERLRLVEKSLGSQSHLF